MPDGGQGTEHAGHGTACSTLTFMSTFSCVLCNGTVNSPECDLDLKSLPLPLLNAGY